MKIYIFCSSGPGMNIKVSGFGLMLGKLNYKFVAYMPQGHGGEMSAPECFAPPTSPQPSDVQ